MSPTPDPYIPPKTLPILRVVVMGTYSGLSEFETFIGRLGWPAWDWFDADGLTDDATRAVALCTPMNRLLFVLANHESHRAPLTGFDADAVMLVASWYRPNVTSGPAKMYGRRVFQRARPLLWLGRACATLEERVLRGALRASGLPADDAESVWRDRDPHGQHLAVVLGAVDPRHPDDPRGIMLRATEGTVFRCGACGEALTRPLGRVRSHPAPQEGERFRYNQRMFPGGGVFAYSVNADAWGNDQVVCGPGPREVAVFDHGDLLRARTQLVGESRGGCCGSVPAGSMNLACACGYAVGYSWSECVFHAAAVVRLDRVRVERAPSEKAAR